MESQNLDSFRREMGTLFGDQEQVDNLFTELKLNEYVPQFNERLNEIRSRFFPEGDNEERLVQEETDWPRLRIYKNKDDITVQADLPGYDRSTDSMNVELEKDHLIITGERNLSDGDNVIHDETENGTYCRKVKIFANVKRERIKASYRNGVLTVVVPRPDPIPIYQIRIEMSPVEITDEQGLVD